MIKEFDISDSQYKIIEILARDLGISTDELLNHIIIKYAQDLTKDLDKEKPTSE